MNLFNEYRKSYITVCFAVAVIYAFTLGEGLSISFSVADGLIYGCLLCLTGLILWNVFRFAIPVNYTPKNQPIFLSAFVIATTLLITGIESFALYLSFPDLFRVFAHSIPVRLFISLLIVVIIRLLYISYHNNKLQGGISYQKESQTEVLNTEISEEKLTGVMSTIAESNRISEVFQPETIFPKTPLDRITVRSGQKIRIIPVNEILYIKADGDYISINTAEGSWLKEQTMKHTENMLPSSTFVRIHRSYIVNINHISRIERYGEKQQVILHNNEKIKISAARYQILKQILGI